MATMTVVKGRYDEEETERNEETASDVSLTPEEQLERLWNRLKENNLDTNDGTERAWPSYDEVLQHMSAQDYEHTMTCSHDLLLQHDASHKTLCPHGVVATAELEFFPVPNDGSTATKPYTGLLQPNRTIRSALLRLSSAIQPPCQQITKPWARTLLRCSGHKMRNAQLFPCVAIKVCRQNLPSGNLLFGGSKVGQRERDFFAHTVCTSMTEQMPRLVKPFVSKFWNYSDHPLSLGVSDFCQPVEEPSEEPHFPFCLILKPVFKGLEPAQSTHSTSSAEEVSSFDSFLDTALSLPSGTVLYDIFACPTPEDVPDPAVLQRIGRIRTTSRMVPSSSSDGLFFRHQRKEHDYALRPLWQEALKIVVTVQGDRPVRGTVGELVGWKLFEQHIEQGVYVDFEKRGQIREQDE
jgi:hypothetical protein